MEIKLGLISILTITFIILKVFGCITLSWWIVFLPMGIYFGILLLIASVVLGTIATNIIINKRRQRKLKE